MNPKTILLYFVFGSFYSFSQSTFDNAMKDMSDLVSSRISNLGESNIAVVTFKDDEGKYDKLAAYITDEFSVHFTNNQSGFTVLDRQYMEAIFEEHKLNMGGFIDSKTASDIGKFTGAKAIATGRFQVMGNSVKIWVKVISTETSAQIAAASETLPVDNNIAFLINQSNSTSRTTKDTSENNPTKSTTISQDSIPTPKIISASICFKNDYTYLLGNRFIEIKGKTNNYSENIALPANSESCLYEIPPSVYKINVFQSNIKGHIIESYEIKIEAGSAVTKIVK